MHDSIITEYRVDFQEKSITVYSKGAQTLYILEATGVLTHHFENVLQSNIILSIEETEIDKFVTENQHSLAQIQMLVIGMCHGTQELEAFLKKEQYKYISIYSIREQHIHKNC